MKADTQIRNVVTPTGFVPSTHDKLQAECAAKRVLGCAAVDAIDRGHDGRVTFGEFRARMSHCAVASSCRSWRSIVS